MVQINFYFPPIRKENVQKKMGGKKAFLSLKLFTDVFIFRAASVAQWIIDNEIDSQ